jgi:AraC family mar-sox-rob regulon transcriptional activator
MRQISDRVRITAARYHLIRLFARIPCFALKPPGASAFRSILFFLFLLLGACLMGYEPPELRCERGMSCVLDRRSYNALRSWPSVDSRVEQIRRFLDARDGSLDWNVDRLSTDLALGISGPHAARLFNLHMGVGIREYATKRRLTRAAERLRNTTWGLKKIATELGYRTPNDLRRQFKQTFRLTPGEFRNIYKLGHAIVTNTVHYGSCPTRAVQKRRIHSVCQL